eukprot:jgi/Chlat1/1605/Chrsp125S01866
MAWARRAAKHLLPPAAGLGAVAVVGAPSVAAAAAPDKEITRGVTGFDAEALERGAKALREIAASPHAKEVLRLTQKQEDTKQSEEKTKHAEYLAMQANAQVEAEKARWQGQQQLVKQNAETKAALARYEDELARQRMQACLVVVIGLAEHEAQRIRNAELVKMQEESLNRQEAVRRATEERIQYERRQTDAQRAELERENIRARALAEAEGRALEARQNEDLNRRQLLARAEAERQKLMEAINVTFNRIGSGVSEVLNDRNKMLAVVGGSSLLALGFFGSREGMRTLFQQIQQVLGQPSLIRESTRRRPWARGSGFSSQAASASDGFGDVVLNKNLLERVSALANATANTAKHRAPFRHILFYGPPGTGKTMAAKQLARQSGLDYAMMSGGDVAPLGKDAVTKIHNILDWSQKNRRGMLLFIDEADAFLSRRGSEHMSENMRSALNAMLFRTGDQSHNFGMVLATNRPEDLDEALVDRVDEALEFPLPGPEERHKILKLYLDKYIVNAGKESRKGWLGWLRGPMEPIRIEGLSDDDLKEAADKLEGFSGRELAKLMASVQGEVYGRPENVLTANLFKRVVDYKLHEHNEKKQFGMVT